MQERTGEITNPFVLKDEDGYSWLKGNLHSHTTNSDGKAEPQERLDGYVGQGYDFLCLSDHHNITRIDSVEVPDGFIAIQGAELHPDNPFGGQKHHFVCLNIHEDMDAQNMPPQHVIDEVNRQGGAVWLAHPHWSSVNIQRDTKPLSGFAGIEVFNTTCRCAGRGESSVHWDDWMELENRLYPALANDDAHAVDAAQRDTYQGWSWVRVKERTAEAVCEALVQGASYSSTGPQIRDIRIGRNATGVVEATVECSQAQRIAAVHDAYGVEYHEGGELFETATFALRPNARWVRFEVVDQYGNKAWSNPFDLSGVE
ncbi:MAG: CehA/McbA family metallohydrolase [Candidatus Latescibacterota bacterium]|mgnify:CR=1 FL=1|jgi:hypothetical protein